MKENKVWINLGETIREYREKCEMTQLDLAKKLGYTSPQFISLFERGISKIPLETIGQLVVLLRIPERQVLDALVEGYREKVKEKVSIGKKSISNR